MRSLMIVVREAMNRSLPKMSFARFAMVLGSDSAWLMIASNSRAAFSGALASMECPKSFCIQRGLAKSTKPRRLNRHRFSVSEGVPSLSDRTSHKLVWIKKT